MTPEKISEEISGFLKTINDEHPFYIDVVADAQSKINECFVNVEEKVKHNGGKVLIGWQVWETKHLIEAEFHAVWRMPSDKIVDITPKAAKGIDKILFLPEPTRSYIGIHVDNVRKNKSKERLVDDLIQVSQLSFYLLNKGKRAMMKEVRLTQAENIRGQKLNQIKNGLLSMLAHSATSHSVCFCGGQLPYRKCHAKELVKLSKSS